MARRIARFVGVLVLLYGAFFSGYQPVYAAGNAGSALNCFTAIDHPVKFSYGGSAVLVCSSIVRSGSQAHLVVRTRKYATIHVQLLFPDGTSSIVDVVADKQGIARPDLPVHYNPITRYAQAQLLVTISRPGHTDVVPGSITVAQALPLGSTRVRARPSTLAGWCPTDRAACTLRNGSTLVIEVDSNPGAQVGVSLLYPDGTSLPCPANILTGTAFTNGTGAYRCQLPIVYQGKGSDTGSKASALVITAQVSVGGYTRSIPLRLTLAEG